jgi:hypothetical protein
MMMRDMMIWATMEMMMDLSTEQQQQQQWQLWWCQQSQAGGCGSRRGSRWNGVWHAASWPYWLRITYLRQRCLHDLGGDGNDGGPGY